MIWETSKNKWKKHSFSKIVLAFHCSNKLQILRIMPQISNFFLNHLSIFSYRKSEQFWQQNTISILLVSISLIICFFTVHCFEKQKFTKKVMKKIIKTIITFAFWSLQLFFAWIMNIYKLCKKAVKIPYALSAALMYNTYS